MRLFLLGLPIILAALGAPSNNTILMYLSTLGILSLIILLWVRKIEPKFYSFTIFSISLSLVFQTTLLSPYLIGTDIHFEYYMFSKSLGGWDTSFPHPFNSSVVLGSILPFIANIDTYLTGMKDSGYLVFKTIPPVFLAFVPVVIYKTLSTFLTPRKALMASLVIPILPPFFLEVTSMVKMEIALIFLALLVWTIYSKVSIKRRLVLFICLPILATITHYTIGLISLLILGGYFSYSLILKRWIPIPNLRLVLVSLIVASVLSLGYLGIVAKGSALYVVGDIGRSFFNIGEYNRANPPPQNLIDEWLPGLATDPRPQVEEAEIPIAGEEAPPREAVRNPFDLRGQSSLVTYALGFDFWVLSTQGRAYWLLQTLLELSMVVGMVLVIKRRKRYPSELLILGLVGFTLLGLNILIPGFSTMLNATRWFLIASLLLAPLGILGLGKILKREKFIWVFIVVYFLFSSGLVFSLTGVDNIEKTEIPYSIALSNKYVDITGVFTREDKAVVDYAKALDTRPLLSDPHGFLLLEEVWGKEGGIGVLARDQSRTKIGTYIFLRTSSVKNREVTFWKGIGLRATTRFGESGMTELLKRCEEVYSVGEAKLLKVIR